MEEYPKSAICSPPYTTVRQQPPGHNIPWSIVISMPTMSQSFSGTDAPASNLLFSRDNAVKMDRFGLEYWL